MSLLRRGWAISASLAAPGLRLMLAARLRRGKEIAGRLPERFGQDATPRPPGRLLWLHAASMGETQSVLPVLGILPAGLTVLLTTGTTSSAALLGQRLPNLALAARVLHRFVPLDVPSWAARFIGHWRPDAAAFVESELWPNLLAAATRAGIPLALLNARMSPRSARGWARVPGLAREVLGSFAWIAAQSAADAARLRTLGARNVDAPGNLKFAAAALPADAAELARLRAAVAGRPVWLAASTHPGEEALVAAAHRGLAARHPALLTIIVPRHPERGAELAAALGAPRRAAGALPGPGDGIWIADTLGELGVFYRLAPCVFLGGSLVPHGGQNPLEPARLGCALAAGPHMHNQQEATDILRAAGALHPVEDAAGLAAWLAAMLDDAAARAACGAAAQNVATRDAALPEDLATRLLAMMP